MNAYVHASMKDNLVTCVKPIAKGETVVVEGEPIVALDDIPIYHKMAIADVKKGESVYKYGEVMGIASKDIRKGEWAHIHNIDSTRGRGDIAH